MDEPEYSWDEWTQDLCDCSYGEIDYTGLSEELAKVKQPRLYECYQAGWDPEEFYCSRQISYEGGDVTIWLDPDEPNDPDWFEELDAILSNTQFFQTFSSEISNLKILNDFETVDDNVLNTLKKQIFVSTITCLETYLSDAFINTVLSNKKYLKSFFTSFNDFKKEKLTMSDLFEKVDQAEEIAKNKMSGILYHNIRQVSNLYKSTLDISFPEFNKIARYVSQRHDCVHRNGKNKDGKILILNKEAIEKVIDDVKDFIEKIDKQLKEKEDIKSSKINEDDYF